MNMKCSELNKLLLESFPDLTEEYIHEVSWQDGDETGSHIVYGDVFTPYIIRNMKNENDNNLHAVFAFLEKVLLKKDLYASEVIAFSVLESIQEYLMENNRYLEMLGAETKKVVEEIAMPLN